MEARLVALEDPTDGTPMSDDYWAALPKRNLEPDEAKADMATLDQGGPMFVAFAFLNALDNLNIEMLDVVVNPESRNSWGDYSAAQAALHAVPDWGVGSEPVFSHDQVEVAYVKVLRHVTASFESLSDDVVNAALIVSLVKRSEYGGDWFVQAIGDYWRPPQS